VPEPGPHPFFTAGKALPEPGIEVPMVDGASEEKDCKFCGGGGTQLSHGALLAVASTPVPSANLGVDGEERRSRRESLSEGEEEGGLGDGDDCVDALVGSQMANGGADPDAFDCVLSLEVLDPGPHPFFVAGFELPAPGIEVPKVEGPSDDAVCEFCGGGGTQLSQGALLADASTSAPSANLALDGDDNRSRRESLSDGEEDGGLGDGADCVDALVGSQIANGGADPDVLDWLLLPLPGLHPFFTAGFELPAPGIEVPIVDGS
jgi:hypothetical protein